MSKLVWARHAESTWNVLGRWQGQSDPGLSGAGQVQAQHFASGLGADPPARIVASDLRRAADTAAAVARHFDLEVELEPRLRERALGEWTGLQHHQVAARWPDELRALQARDLSLRPPGGESLLEVRDRVADWFCDYTERRRQARTLIVTHGGLLRALFPQRFGNTETRVISAEELRVALGLRAPAAAGEPA